MGANNQSYVERLAVELNSNWPTIQRASQSATETRQDLERLLDKQSAPDTSLVVFGSVARGEKTSGSDLDWILLIDGQSAPEHKTQERAIEKQLAGQRYIKPGKSGVFGRMVGSHDLVHNIGGEDDLNSNTTRRVLLLLESHAVGNREAYDRVRRQILRRYLEDDRGLRYSTADTRIPRFLLNDLTRYWRTVTVDFVYKQRAQDDDKWALRNVKLRMSRKLIFAARLLRCFFCHLDPAAAAAREALRESAGDVSRLTEYMEEQLLLTPLELLAKACLDLKIKPETARSMFDSYNRYLSLLDDSDKRERLSKARPPGDLRDSEALDEVRSISRAFHEGLVNLFLRDDRQLAELTMTYGVF